MSATPYPRRTVALKQRRSPAALVPQGRTVALMPPRSPAALTSPRRQDLAAPTRSRLRKGSASADSTVSDGIGAIFIRNRTFAIRVAVTATALAAMSFFTVVLSKCLLTNL